MLPLSSFAYHSPTSLDELLDLLDQSEDKKKLIAGGTDVLPNLKHGLYDIDSLISLKRLAKLKETTKEADHLRLGVLVNLREIAENKLIAETFPTLARASLQIASPQIRNMGTIGGNVCLDTRCLYFNQTEFWRRALGYCLKKDGLCCHVIKTGKRCVAAASNDLGTVLIALNARITIVKTAESKTIPLEDFYTANGEKNNILSPHEVVTSITIPILPTMKCGFYKLRHRNSIDFPLLSVAVAVDLDEHHRLLYGRIVLNALVAKPKVLELVDWKGSTYSLEFVNTVADLAESKSHPQTNICDDKSWRKNMIKHAVIQAFNDAIRF